MRKKRLRDIGLTFSYGSKKSQARVPKLLGQRSAGEEVIRSENATTIEERLGKFQHNLLADVLVSWTRSFLSKIDICVQEIASFTVNNIPIL